MYMSNIIRSIFLSSLLFVGILIVAPVNAQQQATQVNLINPIGGSESNTKGDVDINVIVGRVLQQALTILGSIAFVALVVGGAYWLLSAGNAERVKKGTQTMVWAAVGLFIVFAAYGILSVVIGGLTGRPLVDNSSSAGGAGNEPAVSAAYYKAVDGDVTVWSEPKENVTTKPSVTGDCIAVIGEQQEYFQIRAKSSSSDEEYTGWIKKGDVVESSNANCGGPGVSTVAPSSPPQTACETHNTYKQTHICQETKGWSSRKKQDHSCVSNLCANDVLLKQGKIETTTDGNSWKCCTPAPTE